MASFEAEEGFRVAGRVLRKPSSALAKMPAKPDCKVACACVLATGAMKAISRAWSHGLGLRLRGGNLTPSPRFVESSSIGTLGFLLAGMKIVNLKGERPSFVRMTFRLLLWVLGPFHPMIDLLWLSGDRDRQTPRLLRRACSDSRAASSSSTVLTCCQ